MNKIKQVPFLLLIIISLTSCKGQNQTPPTSSKENQTKREFGFTQNLTKTDTLIIENAPNAITRNIIQDQAGNIWFATFDGIFKYDGNAFTHVSKEVSQSRFFSVMEDRKGDLWFGTVGAGAYCYDGKTFRNFTTDDGLLNNEIVSIYEDRLGNIWMGVNGGVSVYDGKKFRNYILDRDTFTEDLTGITVPNMQRPPNGVNSIMEDDTGNIWLGTNGKMFLHNGKTFSIVKHISKHFSNIRSIIKDKKGNIWFGGNNGLWCFDGKDFTQYTHNFVGHVYEDRQGNIWTSSQSGGGWSLSRYAITDSDEVSKIETQLKSGEGMFFGILEDTDGNIWAGTLAGVYRYDGSAFTFFKK